MWPGGGGFQDEFRFPLASGFPAPVAEGPQLVSTPLAPAAPTAAVVPAAQTAPIRHEHVSKVFPRIQKLANPSQSETTRRTVAPQRGAAQPGPTRHDEPPRGPYRTDENFQPVNYRRAKGNNPSNDPRLKRAYDPSVRPAEGFELVPPALGSTPEGPRVSDTFVETDVRQAVQSLASQVDAVVIIDDQVRGAATAMIDDQPLDVALRQVLLPLGYVHRRVDDVYYVGLAEADSALFNYLSDRYRYTALHRSPEELATLLPKRFMQFVRIASNGGWIIVEAPPTYARQILAELENLDRPIPQVVLEAMVCVYAPEASFRFGFDVDAGVQLYDRSTQLALSGLSLASTIGAGASPQNLNNFQVTSSLLRMLEQRGFVKIRASPRVMALDGQKAKIIIGRETFFSVQPDGNDFIYRQDIQQVDSGIMLEITPAIRDPYVTVKIDRAEVSEDIRSDETQANPSDRFPVINRRNVATTVKVLDGETIVIGGLTQRQQFDQRNKVPFFGDLPVVGKLFNRIEKLDTKAEVAIFISPRILQEGCDCAPTSDEIEVAHADGIAGRRVR